MQVPYADVLGGRGLLGAAHGGHLGPVALRLEPAGLAVGHQAVAHLDTGLGPAGDRPGGTEVDVVGVGDDDQDTLDLFVRTGISGRQAHIPDLNSRVPEGSRPG